MNRSIHLAFLLAPLLGCGVAAQNLGDLRRLGAAGRYVEPGKEELSLAEKLFAELFSGGKDTPRVSELAKRLGFELKTVREAGEEIIVIRETDSHRRGRGMYAFRTKDAAPLVVEAPHSEDDLHTGFLAEAFFLETRAAAVAWNTVPRDQPVEGDARGARGRAAADMAHLPDSVFLAFTRAFAAAHPGGVLVQLHGFAKAERRTEAGAFSDAILSCGTSSPPSWISAAALCLKEQAGARVSVYPWDVSELGATTNVHAKALERARHGGFLHVEMCLELRKRLKAGAGLRKALWRCLPEKQP